MRGIGMALRGDTRGPTDMGVHSGFTGGSQGRYSDIRLNNVYINNSH